MFTLNSSRLPALVQAPNGRRSRFTCGGVPRPQQTQLRPSAGFFSGTHVVTRASNEQEAIDCLQWGSTVMGAAAAVAASMILQVSPVDARLSSGDFIKSGTEILGNALPIDNTPIREIQRNLEGITDELRQSDAKALGQVSRSVRAAQSILLNQGDDISKDFAPGKEAAGKADLDRLNKNLDKFTQMLASREKEGVLSMQREALNLVGKVEEDMVKGNSIKVPPEFSTLPILQGRSTLQMKVHISETPNGPKDSLLNIVIDGYNAPVSAGSFEDLVLRRFYDGQEIQRADGFVIQFGMKGEEGGFKDPKTGNIRRVPLEVAVKGSEPVYNETLEDRGMSSERVVLPFSANGTLAWARDEFDPNSASSQVFFLLKNSELTPTGSNLMDGRFGVFGYVVDGQDDLEYLQVGDKIEYIKVLEGKENLVNGP